jgi:uncharacterized protein (TIGR03083 family)
VILAPRYDGPTVLSIEGPADDQLLPFIRQRRRLLAMLAELSEQSWLAASRCDGWAVRDVVAHLVGVDAFWRASIVAGLAGAPTRVLTQFDPAATPSLMVGRMAALTPRDLLEQLTSATQALFDVVTELSDDGWSTTAESPAGYVSIRLLVQHALWDCWIHERDVSVPLGIPTTTEADEVRSCLQYAAALGPVLGMGLTDVRRGAYAVDASDPSVRFVIDVTESVSVVNGPAPDSVPCLRGDAVSLTEALSLRAPMPQSTPHEWSQVVGGLQVAFGSS